MYSKRQQQDKRIIKGVISDEFGEPLMGVSIKIQGTGMGTITIWTVIIQLK